MHGPSPATNRKRAVTLRQIAGEAQVDVATVSRALACEPGVGQERAEQIRTLARVMGYRPRPLRRRRSDTIGLVVRSWHPGRIDHGYLQRVVYQAELAAADTGRHVHLHRVRGDSPEGEWPRFISENRVDGVVVLGHGTTGFYERLKREPIPAVAVNDTIARTGIDSVMCDPAPGVADAIRRLIDLGHRQVGLVVTQLEFPTVKSRYDTYLRTLQEAGITPRPGWVIEDAPVGIRGGQQAVKTYLAAGRPPSAILFHDDWAAMGGIYELARQGYGIPADVSVVGYDNTAIAEDLSPSLSSIDNREAEVIRQAFALLQERMDGVASPPRQRVVPSRLVWRESCARVASTADGEAAP